MIWTIIGMCQLSHLWCYCQCHINKLENVVLQKIKNIFIKYYNLLLDRWENSEAMDLLYLKIGRKIKKLLTFNRFWLRNMLWNMDNVYKVIGLTLANVII